MEITHHRPVKPLATTTALTTLFALLHLYWAAGGRAGVPDGTGDIADRTWFLAYDVLSALILLGASVAGAVLTVGRGGWRLRRLAVVGAVLAVLRGGIGIAQDVATVVTGQLPGIGTAFDVWFATIGGLALIGLIEVSPPVRQAVRG